MDAKHTPGPWGYRSYLASGRQFGIETADHRHGIAAIRPNDTASTLLTMEEHKANARLIAAAPDLLEALEGLLTAIDYGRGIGDNKAVKAAVDAVAKAKGSTYDGL